MDTYLVLKIFLILSLLGFLITLAIVFLSDTRRISAEQKARELEKELEHEKLMSDIMRKLKYPKYRNRK